MAKDLYLKLLIVELFILVKKSNILMVEYKQLLKIVFNNFNDLEIPNILLS